jgi:hypothetical protein
MSDTSDFSFSRESRSPKAIAGVTRSLAVVPGLWQGVDMAGWITLLLLLPALPALYDLGRNPRAGLTLNAASLAWFSGNRSVQIGLGEIDKVRMDTRWDFSVRVTILPLSGRKLVIPHEALPPHRELEDRLQANGVKVERHHFLVF